MLFRLLVLVMSPIAEGVGVIGGGFISLFATRLRLFGVVGGGGIIAPSASTEVPSCAIALAATYSGALPLRPRFFGGVVVSACWPFGRSESGAGSAWTRADRLNDIERLLLYGSRFTLDRIREGKGRVAVLHTMRANKSNEEDTGKNASSVITIHMLSQDTLLHHASMEMVD